MREFMREFIRGFIHKFTHGFNRELRDESKVWTMPGFPLIFHIYFETKNPKNRLCLRVK